MLNYIANLVVSAHKRQPGDPLVDPPVWRPRWMKWLAAMWIANFAAFVLIGGYLGGDALNGYVKDGHYFVAEHEHGHAIEVSRAVYLYSEWHAISVVLSLAVFLAFTAFVRRRRA